jgi:hypothetical protein
MIDLHGGHLLTLHDYSRGASAGTRVAPDAGAIAKTSTGRG